MGLVELLEREEEQIVAEAAEALTRSNLIRYREVGEAARHERLSALYRFTLQSIRQRNLVPIIEHMTRVAEERFHAGFAIREVQVAINVLEEAIWNHVVSVTPPDELAEALGLTTTVLGAAKDALARTYVSLASETKAPALDLSALFGGKASG